MRLTKAKRRAAAVVLCLPALALVSGVAHAATVIITDGSTVTQNFDSLPSTGSSSTLPDGVLIAETGANANGQLVAGNGSSNAGDTFSFGATGSSERALGGLRSGSLVPLFGLAFTNGTGMAINSLTISFVGEQFRLGTTGRTDQLDFQFGIGTDSLTAGTFTDVNALDFISPNTTGTAGTRDGNAAGNRTPLTATLANLNIAAGQDFTFRFLDFDASGADDGLAIDDFSLTPFFAAVSPVPEPQSWAMMLVGFGFVGAAMRRRKRSRDVAGQMAVG